MPDEQTPPIDDTNKIQIQWPHTGLRICSALSENEYTIGDLINEGNFSFVYECQDLWGNELAAKILKPKNELFETIQQKASAEINIMDRVRHPNVVYIHDAFEFGNLFYIIIERCSHDIKEIIESPDLDGKFWLMPIARCLLQALDFVHRNNLAHCDIHPGNVLYQFQKSELSSQSDSGITFKLSDLGVAKVGNDISVEGTFLNSIRPPECWEPAAFGAPDIRVDIYQAGLLLLQIQRGELLQFTPEEHKAGIPRQMAEKLPAPFDFAIAKMLRRRVIWRTASALEAWRDLNSGTDVL